MPQISIAHLRSMNNSEAEEYIIERVIDMYAFVNSPVDALAWKWKRLALLQGVGR